MKLRPNNIKKTFPRVGDYIYSRDGNGMQIGWSRIIDVIACQHSFACQRHYGLVCQGYAILPDAQRYCIFRANGLKLRYRNVNTNIVFEEGFRPWAEGSE